MAFFDDFTSPVLDSFKWQVTAGTVTAGGGRAVFDGTIVARAPTATSVLQFEQATWTVQPQFSAGARASILIAATTGGDAISFTVDLASYTCQLSTTINGVSDSRTVGLLSEGFQVTGMRVGLHYPPGSDPAPVADGVLFEISRQGAAAWVRAGVVPGRWPAQTPVTVSLTGAGTTAGTGAVTSTGFLFLSDVETMPGPPLEPGPPPALTASSTLVDAFDAAVLDTAKWDAGHASVTMGGGHLTLGPWSTLYSARWDYTIDHAFVRVAVPAQPGEVYASFTASGQYGSPPASWGLTIAATGGGPLMISADYLNDEWGPDSQASAPPIPYDPLAHAFLQVRSIVGQRSGDWYITMICEAGPAPGQWQELLRSPSLPSWALAQGAGFGISMMSMSAVQLADFNVAGASDLSMKMPDGTYRTAGTVGQPLSMRLPDGTMRTWPMAGAPLYQRMPDGTWRTVIS